MLTGKTRFGPKALPVLVGGVAFALVSTVVTLGVLVLKWRTSPPSGLEVVVALLGTAGYIAAWASGLRAVWRNVKEELASAKDEPAVLVCPRCGNGYPSQLYFSATEPGICTACTQLRDARSWQHPELSNHRSRTTKS